MVFDPGRPERTEAQGRAESNLADFRLLIGATVRYPHCGAFSVENHRLLIRRRPGPVSLRCMDIARRLVFLRIEISTPYPARLWQRSPAGGPMSQPRYTEQYPSTQRSSLLDFFSEEAPVSAPVVLGASLEKPAQSAPAVEPVERGEPVPPRDEVIADLRHRLERAERLLDRSVNEVVTLKSDLATLVTMVEDIRKRPSHRKAALQLLPGQSAARISGGRAMTAAVVLAALATGAWGLTTFAPDEVSEAPAVESEPANPVSVPPPLVDLGPPSPIPNAARVSAAASPPAPAPPARAPAPPTRAPARAAPQPAGYGGTLTIDSTPAGDVFLNRERVGRTPVRLEKLRAGSHLIWIEREGYRRWTRVVAVTADRISRVTADLDPISR